MKPHIPQIKTIDLPCYGIKITIAGQAGAIECEQLGEIQGSPYEGILSMILAHAVAGIDVESPAYLEGIETAIESISNQEA